MRSHHMIIFLAMFFFIYFLIYYYFYRRFLKPLRFEGNVKKFANVALLLLVYSTYVQFLLMRFRSDPVHAVSWIAYFMFGFIFTLLPFSIGRDLFLIGFRFLKRCNVKAIKNSLSLSSTFRFKIGKSNTEKYRDDEKEKKEKGDKSDDGEAISRRDFLIKSNYAVLGLSASLSGFGAFEAGRGPKVYQSRIPIFGLPDHLAGFKIVQISDVHVGFYVDRKYLIDVVNQVNELKPDMVALTGDLVDGSVSRLRPHVEPLMDLAPVFGSYFITGNHEYYSGVKEWLKEIERLGFKILMNDHDVIRTGKITQKNKSGSIHPSEKNLVIAGVPDHRQGPPEGHLYDPAGAIRTAKTGDIKILLAHQPVAVDQALDAGYHLQFSGHTHGGQFFPYSTLVPLVYRYNAGLYSHTGPNGGKMWIYVNRGTGYWGPPIRTGVRAEISLLTLEKPV